MGIFYGIGGSGTGRQEWGERDRPVLEEQRVARSRWLGTGTLACPVCDAPVAPAPRPMSPADGLACPVCDHAAAVRDFLSLAVPSRPARVEVRVVERVPLPAASG